MIPNHEYPKRTHAVVVYGVHRYGEATTAGHGGNDEYHLSIRGRGQEGVGIADRHGGACQEELPQV